MSELPTQSSGADASTPRVSLADALRFARDAFDALGVPADEAQMCAEALLESELRFHPGQGQGLKRLLGYEMRLGHGYLTPGAPFEVLKESPALALVDAHNGLGSVVARKGIELACDKAAVSGFGVVMVRGSTHYGSSSLHALRAVDRGMIGVAITNAGPELAAWGGRTPVLGTNPWGLAAPTGADFPVALDIALTTAGKGMMRFLAERGEKMPLDWALTPEGHETDDPNAAMAGALLGIGQYKGVGLSFFSDVLTGVISGGAFGLTPYSNPAKLDVAHTFMAIDISWFMQPGLFHSKMQAFMAEIKSSQLRPGFKEVLIPGEIEHRRASEKRANGVPFPESDLQQLIELADRLGIDGGALRAAAA